MKAILQTVKKYEEAYGIKIPTALAGGIDTREKVSAAFAMGVDAIQAATPFVTTEECDADIRYKEAYIQAKGEKIPHKCHQCLAHCKPAEIPYCITDALIHAARGEVDDALLFCGADAWKAEKITTVSEVIQKLL